MTHFNNTKAAEDIFREKRIPKNPIKFKVPLNEEQKEAKEKRREKAKSCPQRLSLYA